MRIKEIGQSFSLIRQAVAQIPAGPIAVPVKGMPNGEYFTRIEQPRGEAIYYVKANGTKFIDRFRLRTPTTSNIPPMLNMLKDPDETCPFVTPAGCHVYEDRPSACRSYPLGRGTQLSRNGVSETFYLVQEPHCHGFDDGRDWTAREWFEHEGLEPYNVSNDRYMRLGAMITASGSPISEKMGNMALLCLYQLDRFREFITTMNIFKRVEVDEERQKAIMESDEAALEFGYDWVELVLFGQSEGLKKKGQA